ncbi:hypothetical protein J4573_34125 [Actinomadura barringtoniae]|uniref:Uncharacterized protein n=1 Tax=Actinomadura barringtoniae TaxID=1427535 RepID=A0A939T7M4_9ACTN|nr:hypothetical protein [Actinomadura barringtoniae]MBO2452169.1 hypothetical protein [Actinomadura barringtoniae]
MAIFSGYVLLGITGPGLLWWRVLWRSERRFLAEELAAGTALGYVMEVFSYIPSRALGLPLLVLVWPIGSIAAFLVIPSLRRWWRGPGPGGRMPLWTAWALAALFCYVAAFSAASHFRFHGIAWPGIASPTPDIPWQLSMAGEVKHHIPATFPQVLGEPLLYHWFAYADMAATSWVTGIELQTLLVRLSPLPMLAVYTVLIVALARRVTGRWWTGPLAAALCFFTMTPQLSALPQAAGWTDVVSSGTVLNYVWWSPTQTFGAMLCLPLVLVLTQVLCGQARSSLWLLLCLLLAAETAAKGTFLPLLLAGLLLTVGVHGVVRRRLHRAAAASAGLTAAALCFAQLVLFRGETQGIRWAPLHTVKRMEVAVPEAIRMLPLSQHTPVFAGAAAVFMLVVGWFCMCAGALGLLRERTRLLDPMILLFAGMGAAAMAVMLVSGHPFLSQIYFLQSARPYLGILAAAGFAAVVPRATSRPALGAVRIGLPLVAAALAGVVIVCLARWWDGSVTPSGDGWDARALARLTPYGLLGMGVLVVVVLLLLARRWAVPLRGLSTALTLAVLTGIALSSVKDQVVAPFEETLDQGWGATTGWPTTTGSGREAHDVPAGAMRAGRWLRGHSDPSEVVAANVHCRASKARYCDPRHFWISAYTERRVLVEGWGYLPSANARAALYGEPQGFRVPFEDQARLAANDAAFSMPSKRALDGLRSKYGVHWLFVDERFNRPGRALGLYAVPRFRAGDCAVYEVPA